MTLLWRAKIGVRVVVAILTFAAIGFVARFGSNAPMVDEWDLTPEMMRFIDQGKWYIWLNWPHNEHRFPLGKLIHLVVLNASGGDFRWGMVFSVFTLGLSSLFFVSASEYLRNRSSWSDILIPSLLLNWGAAYNFLMAYQIVYSLFVLSIASTVWLIVKDQSNKYSDLALILSAVIMPLQGVAGIACAGPFLVWLIFRSFARHSVANYCAVFLISICVVGYCLWVILDAPPKAETVHHSLEVTLEAAGSFLAVGHGAWIIDLDSHIPLVVGLGEYLLFGLLTLKVLKNSQNEKMRVSGLFALLLGFVAMGIGVGISRGGIVDRYSTLSAAGLLTGWVLFSGYAPNCRRKTQLIWGFIAILIYLLDL